MSSNALVVKLVDTKDLKPQGFTNSIVSEGLRQSQIIINPHFII